MNLIWASLLTWASPCDVNFSAGGLGGGAVSPPTLHLPPILLHMTILLYILFCNIFYSFIL